MSLLLSAEAEIKTNGFVSPELLEKILEEGRWIKIAKRIADERKIPLSEAKLLLAIKKTARQLETIPDGAVERVIRYGNAIERQLNRAYARLNRPAVASKGKVRARSSSGCLPDPLTPNVPRYR
jgi:hypothetical protein